MTTLIALGGLKTHGKDAAADYLVEMHGFTKIGMSDTLAEALYRLNPWINRPVPFITTLTSGRIQNYTRYQRIADRIGYTKAKEIPEVRQLLQRLGTEVGRDLLFDSLWVDITARTIKALHAENKNVVLTGIRFDNELGMVEELGGTTAWVERDKDRMAAHRRNISTKAADGHASEATLSALDFEIILDNTGTLADLYRRIENLIVPLPVTW